MHILSFDIEDWYLSYHSSGIPTQLWPEMDYRTEKNTNTILDFLDDHRLKATFFILGYEARQNPLLVRDIHRAGHDIGYHSTWHVPLYATTAHRFRQELYDGLALLSDIISENIIYYRAPMFSLDGRAPWAPEILAESGIQISSSVNTRTTFAGRRLPDSPFIWQTPAGRLMEFPMPALRFGRLVWRTTGGGYFRIWPYSFIRNSVSNAPYVMYYFHPRDVDTGLAGCSLLPAYRNMMSRWGNHTTLPKLRKLARHIRFIPISTAHAQLSTQNLPVINTTGRK